MVLIILPETEIPCGIPRVIPQSAGYSADEVPVALRGNSVYADSAEFVIRHETVEKSSLSTGREECSWDTRKGGDIG